MKIWFDKNTWRAVYMFGVAGVSVWIAGVSVWIAVSNIKGGNECMKRAFKIDED